MRLDYDVLVVGASCAGLGAAYSLSRAGLRTAVLDSRHDLSEAERTWIVTHKINQVIDFPVASSVVHETSMMKLIANGSSRRVRLTPPDLVIDRGKLRQILVDRAQAEGSEIFLGHRVEDLQFGEACVRASVRPRGSMRKSTLRARDVIGADGVRSLVAQRMGARSSPVVPVLQARVRLPGEYDPRVTHVWFDLSRTRFFYWLIPDSPTTGVLGLIAEDAQRARGLLDVFMAERGFSTEGYQAAMIPLHVLRRRIDWRVGSSRVLLVGDAAGHVKVTTVGGVVSGLWGARAAARALVRGTPYRLELASLYRELIVHDAVRWILDRFEIRHYDRLLRLLNRPVLEFLETNDRDSFSRRVLVLARAQPRLLSLALSALIASRDAPADPGAALTAPVGFRYTRTGRYTRSGSLGS